LFSHLLSQAPQLDITTVAAGGGSRLFFQSGLLKVGPESAGERGREMKERNEEK
jgi:N-methylhydantoinase A/oxoprolinase/acetone carboxylase beta subunit